jgi:beta-mannosidase
MSAKDGFARERRLLADGWTFRRAGEAAWLRASVPGSNFSDLLQHGLIEDPFDGDAESRLQWIEREDWEYRCQVELTAADLAADSVEILFEGLDTYCTVTLNGVPLLTSDDMFRSYRAECRHLLRVGTNELLLHFDSPVRLGAARRASEGLLYPAENDKTEDHVSVYVRKAPYHFGWDWGPKYVTSGVWRPAWLDIAHKARIRDCRHEILSLSPEKAEVAFTVEIESYGAGEGWIELACQQTRAGARRVPLTFEEGVSTQRIAVEIDDPRLWWPNGLGEAFLYRFAISIEDNSKVLDTTSLAVGLRTVEIVNGPDEHGESFYVRVNGRPTFMKGANYIPLDSFQESVTPERYQRLFRDVVDANMNMLRVWGGGTYERDLFYDLADEHGILIWQDFMFACTLYPSDQQFLDRVSEEAGQVVKRLRNHACLALWCGNNEVSLGISQWDWPTKFGYLDAQFADMVAGNRKLFNEIIPAVIAEHDPSRFYLPSSPTGDWRNAADDARGNGHYWGVWHGELPFSTYADRVPRFMTEYGFQSYPLLDSIRRFTEPRDRHVGSAVLGAHQKHPRGDSILTRFIGDAFGEPASFEHFCYLSQVLQADGLRVAFEAHRRAMPFCMGSLYWQLNDCWPAISWSSIDYYGRWKALQYQAARSFAPILLSAEERDGAIRIHGVSDLMDDVSGKLAVEFVDFDGNILWRREVDALLGANQSIELLRLDTNDLTEINRGFAVMVLRLVVAEAALATSIVHLESARLSALPDPGLHVEPLDDRKVRVRSDRFARAVFLSAEAARGTNELLQFEDNFFDLLPGETRVITTRDNVLFDPATLRLLSVHDAIRQPINQVIGTGDRAAASGG